MSAVPPRRTGGRAQRRWVPALRATVVAVAAVVLCWPVTQFPGLTAAFVGAWLGSALGHRAGRSRLRGSAAAGLPLALLAVGAGLSRLVVGTSLPAAIFGPTATLHLGEAVLWSTVTSVAAFLLRFFAVRRPPVAILEVFAVAGATAVGFAAHRDGMVHRPLAVGDWAWSRGLDPAVVFLVLGGLGALLLAGLLVQEGRLRRLPLHFAGLVIVALLLVTYVRFEGLPKPDPASDLGLTGEPEDGEGDASEQPSGGRGNGQGREAEGRSGEGDRHELGDLEFKDDYGDSGEQSPIAVVLLHDDYSPPSGVYYFRQSAFSQFNGRRLVQSTRDDVDTDIVRRFPFKPVEVADAPPPFDGRKALVTTVGLLVDHVRPFALDAPARLEPAPNPNPMRFQRMFKVRSHVQVVPYPKLLGRFPGDSRWTAPQWTHYTEAPSDPRYEDLAASILETLRPEYRTDPLAQALSIKSYLDQNGIYSRRSKHADDDDPAASFLFGDLTGYCVHFAHAAAYLFRSQGIPARVAAGYAVAESDRGNGSAVMIRGGSAHAWPEIYLEDVGWVVVDLTPEQSLDEAQPAPDQRLQQMLGEMMRDGGENDEFSDRSRSPIDWQEIRRRLLWAAAALLALAYLIKIYRLWLAPRRRRDRPRTAYRAVLDRLSEVGRRRRFGETREAFARRLQGEVPSFGALTRLHLEHALGAQNKAANTNAALVTARQTVRELAATVPWWRRLLGRLNPLSWVWVK